jgi:MFS family permease
VMARILSGLAVGSVSVAVPLYISEISPAEIRGALVSFNHLAIVIGVLLSYLVGAAFAMFEHGWRYMFICGSVPAVIFGLGMLSRTFPWTIPSKSASTNLDARWAFSAVGCPRL